MPLARYFFSVGGVLLALLFIADAYLPKLPVADSAVADLPVIRIHSDRKWPERVVYDTGLPTIIPAQTANTGGGAPAPATLADVSDRARGREAFAQLQPSDANQPPQSDPQTPKPKPPRKRKIEKRRAAPSIVVVARHPQFGLFGTGIW